MNREAAVRSVHREVEALSRLHQHGLYNSTGYQARKQDVKERIRELGIDVMTELDPVTLILYRRYLE